MISQETQVKHAQMTGEMPTRKSAYSDPWFKTDQTKEVRFWMNYMEKYGRTPQYPVRFGELSQLTRDAVQRAFSAGFRPRNLSRKRPTGTGNSTADVRVGRGRRRRPVGDPSPNRDLLDRVGSAVNAGWRRDAGPTWNHRFGTKPGRSRPF